MLVIISIPCMHNSCFNNMHVPHMFLVTCMVILHACHKHEVQIRTCMSVTNIAMYMLALVNMHATERVKCMLHAILFQ